MTNSELVENYHKELFNIYKLARRYRTKFSCFCPKDQEDRECTNCDIASEALDKAIHEFERLSVVTMARANKLIDELFDQED